ncbi:glycosyltransferase [Candidatus Wolfebacteria bacterium]|nr:glycosyltransferase [Candidatus Wolfebacteria bacterium]
MICKYPPIQGGVSAECYWTANMLAEMGHEVHVLTNAQEVEAEYRIEMMPEDEKLLTGFRKEGSIRVWSTHVDKKHVFIPQTNPSMSKLLSAGLEVVEAHRPDFILAHYLEPYGVVAFMLSRLTGVPYVFRHAGSDIGRLMLTSQLGRIHREVLREALFVMTQPSHRERFASVGVRPERLMGSVSTKMRHDLFCPTPFSIRNPFVLGVYGKVGRSKGTEALIRAVKKLPEDGCLVKLRTHWGGRDLGYYESFVGELGVSHLVDNRGFIPHWRIPRFIQSCDAVLFLENRFGISFHQPSIPLEVLSCGRPLITTAEVANKPTYRELIRDGQNAFVLDGAVTMESVASEIVRAQNSLQRSGVIQYPGILPNSEVWMRVRMQRLLDTIQQRL